MTTSSGSLRPAGLVGVVWGGALLWRGPGLFEAVQGRPPSPVERDAIKLLGARHLGQGAVQLLAPYHLQRVYAAVDGLHAASMIGLAALRPARRRAALVSGAIAALAGCASLYDHRQTKGR